VIFVEWHAGEGGTEAGAWLEMLRRMHLRWSETQGWQVNVIDEQGEPTVRKCVAKIKGLGAESFFKNEQGVHKLTRVSPYGNGKKHTSCVSVAVLKKPEVSLVVLQEKELKWDTFRGTGAGGQHRNKRDTAVRLTHLPTDTVVTILSGRSQHQNKQEARDLMRAKLQSNQNQVGKNKIHAHIDRLQQGFGHQVRTYKLDQHMVRDERSGKTHHHPQKVLDGDLEWCRNGVL
jgi:peptide chain release factor 2